MILLYHIIHSILNFYFFVKLASLNVLTNSSPRFCNWPILFKSKEETGEDEHGDADDQHDDPKLLPGLVQCVEEALQPNEMTNHLENAENSHHSDLRWNWRKNIFC